MGGGVVEGRVWTTHQDESELRLEQREVCVCLYIDGGRLAFQKDLTVGGSRCSKTFFHKTVALGLGPQRPRPNWQEQC